MENHEVVMDMMEGTKVISNIELEITNETGNSTQVTPQNLIPEPATQKPFLLRFDVTKVGKPGQA